MLGNDDRIFNPFSEVPCLLLGLWAELAALALDFPAVLVGGVLAGEAAFTCILGRDKVARGRERHLAESSFHCAPLVVTLFRSPMMTNT